MNLQDFGRELRGRPPKNRDYFERLVVTDEDGCSYDRQVATVRLSWPVGIAVIVCLLVLAWASDDPAWRDLLTNLGEWADIFKRAVMA
jgi:hypothetical protein